MNFKRIGRALVCLLLVCCLCFNMVTVPAKASVLGQTLWILGESVIASIIKGCGVHAGEEAADFNQVVSQCWEDIKADTQWYEWILGDSFMVQKFGSDTEKAMYCVQLTLLEAVRQWLFDSGVLKIAGPVLDDTLVVPEWALAEACAAPYAVLVYWGQVAAGVASGVYLAYSYESPLYARGYSNGTGVFIGADDSSATLYLYHSSDDSFSEFTGSAVVWNSNYMIYSSQFIGASVPKEIVSSSDLILKSLTDPTVSFATGYQDWTANSVTVKAESDAAEDEVYYPLGLGQTYEETVGLTQEDVWAGNSTYVEVTVDSEITADSVAATPWATFTQWISAGWAKLETAILSIPTTIINGIRAIFVPAEDFVTVKVTAIRMEFPFIGPILEVGEFIGNQMSGFDTSPPIIYIDLGATRGSYDIGGKVAFIDMTWYAEYKPTVDTFLSALLWIVFWWKMFKRLPGLISGLPGDFVMDGLNSIGLADHLPSRNAAYEIQRRDNHNSVWRRR